ncbi:MAG: aldo/keto reductase [Myxococcaceae bacterium]|nr:aldo/keto reductase [Myxococcaceae bacterium]
MYDRRAALTFLREHLDVTSEAGDGLVQVQHRFRLSTVEVATLLLEAHRSDPKRPKPKAGSILQRLYDSKSADSIPYAEPVPFEPDPAAPRLDGIGTVTLGKRRIPRLGVGCMRLVSHGGYVDGEVVTAIGLPLSPEANRHALLNAVQGSGVRMLDLARGYGPWPGFGEGMLCDWFPLPRRGLMLASKVGYRRTVSATWAVDLDPKFLRAELTASRQVFGAAVPLMYLVVRSTPTTPVVHRPKQLARALAPLVEAQREGEIELLGVANVTADELEVLREAGPIAAVQNRFTLGALRNAPQRAVFDRCAELGLPFVTWGIFGEGVQPRPEAAPVVVEAAEELGVTAEELTLATLLAAGAHVVPLPGPGRRASLDSCLRGAALRLPAAMRQRLLGALM